MLYDRILSSADVEPSDSVDIAWHECAARALRKTTRARREVRILLPLGRSLRDGDVLAAEATGVAREGEQLAVLRVHVPACEVWVTDPVDPDALATVALELGNLHVPVQVSNGRLIVIADGPTREALDRYGVPFRTERRVFAPLRATVLQGVKLAPGFEVRSAKPQAR
ncbi:MAG TPA: hypothetical protein VGN72_23175 [Tepidisphaeraceae bacterium]|jgi:urease accessory protein UreE|nr:hypothetical protein [Tepidisphaeraceae bacterium]